MIRLLRALRSTAAFALLLPTFAPAGSFQRLLIWPLLRLLPRCLDGVLSWFMHLMVAVVLVAMRLGGARIRSPGSNP